ncbi:MAG: hypothetical protein N2652_06910 [Kiritimatiellae bacterium]|nr:hypothetical protein [Kiritimatiellia bacterium]
MLAGAQSGRRWAVGAVLALGACGVAGQVLLWRELVALYQGNELTTGIILANWLLAEAIGAAVAGRRAPLSSDASGRFALLSAAYALGVTASLVGARLLRPAAGLALAQPVGTAFTMLTSLVLQAPPSLLHGALFPMAGRLCDAHGAATGSAVATLYVWESLGTLLGAIAVKIAFSLGIHAVVIVAAIWGLTAIVLATSPPPSPHGARRRAVRPLAASTCAVAAMLAAGAAPLHRWLLVAQFHPYPVLAHTTSPLANWTVLGSNGQYIFAADGQPVLLSPEPDRVGAQTTAHLPLLWHPAPRRVAVIGGGLGGLLEEILKHHVVESVHCVEADAALVRLYRRFCAEAARSELDDLRVRMITGDGRRLLRRLPESLDLIWVGVGEPVTLQQNRYFTTEFFAEVRRRLAPDGIMVLSLPGRIALVTEEQQRLHACMYESLRRTMQNVRVLPGEGHFLYLASPERDLSEFSEHDWRRRRDERGLQSNVPLIWPLVQRLHPGWTEWFAREYLARPAAPNRDLHPRALFHALADRQAVHEPRLAALLGLLHRRAEAVATVGTAVVVLAAVVATLRRRRHAAAAPPAVAVATTGMAGMMWDLVVIVAFQSALGHVQTWIGLLMAAYMLGAAGAAAIMGARAARTRHLRRALGWSDAALAVACAMLPSGLAAATRLSTVAPGAAIALFLALNLAGGALSGALFPLAAAWRSAHGEETGRTAGALQAADLAGGWSAGLLGAVLVLPLAGVGGACVITAALKLLSLFWTACTLSVEPVRAGSGNECG